MESKTLNSIFKNASIIFIVFGLAMIVAAIIGGVPPYFTVPFSGQGPLVSLGMIVAVGGSYVYWYENFKRPEKEIDYGIKIHSPIEGNTVKSPIQATGTYKILPNSENIYSFEYNPSTDLYWPKGKVVFNPNLKSWSAQLNIGGGDYKPRRLIIAEVSEGGLVLINYYKIVISPGNHKGIPGANKAFKILDQVNIILEKP